MGPDIFELIQQTCQIIKLPATNEWGIKIKELLIEEKLWAAEIDSGKGFAAVDENENLE